MAALEWHGTPEERRELATVTDRNCTCEYALMGIQIKRCPLHEAVFGDQRFMDGLVFVRRTLRARMLISEWHVMNAS